MTREELMRRWRQNRRQSSVAGGRAGRVLILRRQRGGQMHAAGGRHR